MSSRILNKNNYTHFTHHVMKCGFLKHGGYIVMKAVCNGHVIHIFADNDYLFNDIIFDEKKDNIVGDMYFTYLDQKYSFKETFGKRPFVTSNFIFRQVVG